MEHYNSDQLVREAEQFMSQYENNTTRSPYQLDVAATKLELAIKAGIDTIPQIRRLAYLTTKI